MMPSRPMKIDVEFTARAALMPFDEGADCNVFAARLQRAYATRLGYGAVKEIKKSRPLGGFAQRVHTARLGR